MRRALCALILLASVASGAWTNGYTYKATFTVNAAQVSGTQTNFPALISSTYTDLKTVGNGGQVQNTATQTVGNRAISVPADLIFTSDSAGVTLLSWEFETYNAATGAVNIWVNVPSIATSTIVYGWYGNAAVTTLQTTPTSTWSANYLGVWHMPEDPSGSAPQLNDSTTNVNHGTTVGSMTTGEQAAAKINGGITPNGTTQYATLANTSNFAFERTDSWSTEAWYFTTANASSGVLAKQTNSGAFPGWALFLRVGATNPSVGLTLDANAVANASILNTHTTAEFSQSAWHHIVATYSGNSNTSGILLYVDGAVQAKTDIANTLTTSILTVTGAELFARDTTPGIPMRGALDEVRVSAKGVVLSANWISSEYNNQNAPNTFWAAVTGLTSGTTPVAVGGGALPQ